jgi:arylsulfatase A-like enzyme
MTANREKKPNILYILSDDHGAWAMNCAGNHEIVTPNLDRLAREGMRFDNFFCTSPVCSPARASILTGRIPSRHGVMDWIEEREIEYLEGQLAYTELLAENGYICGLNGKWHLGNVLKPQKGFTEWNIYPGGNFTDFEIVRSGVRVPEKGYVTNTITEDSLRFLERYAHGDQPFYLGVHYSAPHSPWLEQHPQRWVDYYDDCEFETCPQGPAYPGCNFNDFQWSYKFYSKKHEVRYEDIDVREYLKGYFAAVSAMDEDIGRLLDKVEELGIRENTLIIYMSDNGFNCGHHGIWGKGNTFPQNMFDTSVKVPAIFSQPGFIPAGLVNDALLSQYDMMPTLLEYAGIPMPNDEKLPGRSFLSELKGECVQDREQIVVYDEYGPVRMIRSKTWKYVHRYPYGPHELYDLVNDPGETVNLIDRPEHEDRIFEMRDQLERWFVQYGDPLIDGARQPV